MIPTKLNLRVDSVKGNEHVHCSLFMNGALCGKLIFRIGEYQDFGACLLLGTERMKGHLIDQSNDSKFKEWIEKGR